ncbi:ribosomal maturation YjgA family protein [Paenibacillus macquariensis]|uniref:DUF2809 domain-containing protein n=1 Tax=Paenibacillus macquariensis TaxID=948756 RepID=A0ABY1KBB8_9BACL|nr:DUF2809 domain-containing protein [Paenibacillus macquariensis]MEC0094245.1 DUF2809 domain-containing protein [Paenibacillus macquariensis]SIR55089.1 Protein of unknown function [Paenibacillus macquariensis]
MNDLRNRVVYIIVFFMVIILGISSRSFTDVLPVFVSRHFGDALWASMVYFGCRILFLKQRLLVSVCLSIVFSYSIEFSQLYQADWINAIRSTLLGALILGKGFLGIDLIRYTVGIVISFVVDWLWVNHMKKKRMR